MYVHVCEPEVELIFTMSLWKDGFNVKYFENGIIYDVGRIRGQI